SEIARPDELDHTPVVFRGVNLRADLADAVVLPDGIAHGKAFGQVARHRLLQVEVLAGLARGDCQERVPVGRSGDDHGVKVLLGEHLAEVAVALAGALELLDHRLAVRVPDIAGGGDYDVGLAGAGGKIGAP